VQKDTRLVLDAISGIGRTIADVDRSTQTIAQAVDQQGMSTRDIAREVQQAAAGTTAVTQNMHHVDEAISSAAGAADTLLGAAVDLRGHADQTTRVVRRFLEDMRAA